MAILNGIGISVFPLAEFLSGQIFAVSPENSNFDLILFEISRRVDILLSTDVL